jgi:hypothetical protein
MPERDPERLEIAEEIRRQIAAENTLTPVQARAFVRGLQTAWDVPTIQWAEAESRTQLADALRLFSAAGIFQKVEGGSSPNAVLCYRRAGELLEWLSRAGDDLETFVPLELLAAGSYQLGGLPAMASALISQIPPSSRGETLYAQFLQGDFDGVLRSVGNFWRGHLDIADREAPSRLLNGDGDDKVSWYFTVELVRVLGALADALRRGDNARFGRVMAKLAGLEKLAVRTFSDDASLLISLLHQVATGYGEASIYGPVRQLSALSPDRAPRLEAFARTQFNRGRGILWTSQRHGIARLLAESSFALCTPTGSGKTLVANLALLKELLLREDQDPAPLALYLVPSRALAGEVEAKLTGELGNDLIITGLYGGSDWGVTDYWLNADRPTVLIATVEKAEALMRYLGPLISRRLRLLIVDEAHQVVPVDDERTQADFAEHSSRPIRLESFVSRLLVQSPDIVRIALTAVAGGAALPVARWIEGRQEATSIGTRYRSTRQLIGVLETAPDGAGRMLLELMNGRPLFVRGRDEPVYIRLRTPPMPPLSAAMRNSIYRFNELDVLWTALHLVADDRRILISVAQQPEKTMGWYKDALELESWQDAVTFAPPEDERLRARFDEARAACIDYCGEDSYELALLDRGIATNHGQMPQRLRRLMTDLIDRGICPITVATATLTEGVNLPFDIILVTALKRRSFDPANNRPVITPMSTAEFRNLAGRAGRPGASNGMEGITLVAIPRRPSSTARGQIPTQRKQIQDLRTDYRALRQSLLAEELEHVEINGPLALLLNSIAERALDLFGIAGDEFLEWLETAVASDISDEAGRAATSDEGRLADSVDELDGVLLSALEEMGRLQGGELQGAAAEAALANLWRRTFTAYAAVQENWLERAFIMRGQAILDDIYPDANERARLYQYGFTPYVGRRFEAIAPALKAIIEAANDYGSADPAERLSVFAQLGDLLTTDRGYGFRVRATETDRALLDNWNDVLGWWMQSPGAPRPEPAQLRAWQRFVAENIEFRLGVAVGAVVARAWSDGAGDPFAIPSLEAWRDTTGLPWFGFWARELLRWGTLDPFVAFALAQGLARTRDEASAWRPAFQTWLDERGADIVAEDLIDPQLFMEWQGSLPRAERHATAANTVRAQIVGTTGARGMYRVIPVSAGETINWLDAAGYVLAQSQSEGATFQGRLHGDDFQLHTDVSEPYVSRVFAGR